MQGLTYLSVYASLQSADTHLRTGNFQQARQDVERTLARAETLGLRELQARAEYVLASALRAAKIPGAPPLRRRPTALRRDEARRRQSERARTRRPQGHLRRVRAVVKGRVSSHRSVASPSADPSSTGASGMANDSAVAASRRAVEGTLPYKHRVGLNACRLDSGEHVSPAYGVRLQALAAGRYDVILTGLISIRVKVEKP